MLVYNRVRNNGSLFFSTNSSMTTIDWTQQGGAITLGQATITVTGVCNISGPGQTTLSGGTVSLSSSGQVCALCVRSAHSKFAVQLYVRRAAHLALQGTTITALPGSPAAPIIVGEWPGYFDSTLFVLPGPSPSVLRSSVIQFGASTNAIKVLPGAILDLHQQSIWVGGYGPGATHNIVGTGTLRVLATCNFQAFMGVVGGQLHIGPGGQLVFPDSASDVDVVAGTLTCDASAMSPCLVLRGMRQLFLSPIACWQVKPR